MGPISWPDLVTAEFNAMFWALNGATERPRRASTRQRPAPIVDLPEFEDGPQIIRAGEREVMSGAGSTTPFPVRTSTR